MRREVRAIIKGVTRAAIDEAAAVNENHDGQIFSAACPNVKRQTIFALLKEGGRLGLVSVLNCRVAEFLCVEGLIARRQGFGGVPAKFADGRFGVGNAQPRLNAAFVDESSVRPLRGLGLTGCGLHVGGKNIRC